MKKIWILATILAIDYLLAQGNKTPKIIIKKKLPFNYNAMTVPPLGIYITENQKDNRKLLQHEFVHWQQYRETGAIIFVLKYLIQKLLYGYDKMPLEIEARKIVGETNFCAKNYTECVKSGNAITVSNKEFRN